LVEFALVGVIMFMTLTGILETGRLLLAYSVVSNAAQEGSRYAIIRPRDVITRSEATQAAALGTPTYVPEQVVADDACNIGSKAKDKVWGIVKSDVQVAVWYDAGDGTPIPVSSDPSSSNYLDAVVKPGNRVVVETDYTFEFVTPFLSAFAPNGIDVKMRSARTMLTRGNATYACVNVNYPPPPTGTPTPSNTPTSTNTPTPTNTRTWTSTVTPTITRTPTITQTSTVTQTSSPTPTSTATRTNTATATRTPSRLILSISPLKENGGSKSLDIRVRVTDDNGNVVSGATVVASASGSGGSSWGPGTLAEQLPSTAGTYQVCKVGSFGGSGGGNVTVTVSATKGSLSGSGTATEGVGVWCP